MCNSVISCCVLYVYLVLISFLWPFCCVIFGLNLFTSALLALVKRSFRWYFYCAHFSRLLFYVYVLYVCATHFFFCFTFIYKKINRMYKKEIKKARAEVTPK